MADNTKIMLGPGKVTFDEGGTTPVVLDNTIGGIQLNYSATYRETTTDQTGTTPVKKHRTGQTVSVVVPFAEQDLTKLQAMIPGSTLVTGSTSGTKRIDIDAEIVDLLDFAKKLKLEPISGTVEDTVILFKAAPELEISQSFTHDNERIWNVTFVGYPDTANGNKLLSIGDPNAA